MNSYVEEGVQLARDLQKVRLHGPVPVDTVAQISKACVELADEREKMLDSLIECIVSATLQGRNLPVLDILRSAWNEQEIAKAADRVEADIRRSDPRSEIPLGKTLEIIDGGKE